MKLTRSQTTAVGTGAVGKFTLTGRRVQEIAGVLKAGKEADADA